MTWFEKYAVTHYLFYLALPETEWPLYAAAIAAFVSLAVELYEAKPIRVTRITTKGKTNDTI